MFVCVSMCDLIVFSLCVAFVIVEDMRRRDVDDVNVFVFVSVFVFGLVCWFFVCLLLED